MRVLALTVVLFLMTGVSHAEVPGGLTQAAGGFHYTHLGYGVVGIGVCQHGAANINAGGGVEVFVSRGLTAGGDINYQRFIGESGYGLATANAGYHFVDRTKMVRKDPYVSGGVGSAFAIGGSVVAGSVGGGLNYWFKPGVGMRTEGRVYLYEDESIFMFHIGFSFR